MFRRVLSFTSLILLMLVSTAPVIAQETQPGLADSIPVPEPGTLLLVGGGLYLLGRNLRKRSHRQR